MNNLYKGKSPQVLFKLFKTMFLLGGLFLFFVAVYEYKGESYIYILFSIISNVLLYSGFRKNAIFFDTFIGIFFWLGFWLKFTVRIAFFDGQFHEAIGSFDSSSSAFDRSLLVSSCGFMGLLVASHIRERFFIYPSLINEKSSLGGLFILYEKYRKLILLCFMALIIFIAFTNYFFGIYQRGTSPTTVLPYGLNGVYKWLLLFGLGSITALLIRFEYSTLKSTSYWVIVIGLIESFLSNISLLSRGMILNTSALFFGLFKAVEKYRITMNLRFYVTSTVVFLILFGSSIVIVNYIRSHNFYDGKPKVSSRAEVQVKQTKLLFLDRWVGIEGVMAVSSYQNQGWQLWWQAWDEVYSENEISFYDKNIIVSPYRNTDMTKHHFISLPGVLAFCFYPGSFLFLFFCMFSIGLFASAIEIIVFSLGGKNVILCALLAQVVAFRYASFGYVPAQSYLLFGTIFFNIIIIFIADKLLKYWFNRNGMLS